MTLDDLMRNFQDLVTHARAQSVLATIKREHEGLATVLHVLWLLAEDVRKHGVEPDFKLFATILYYIAAFYPAVSPSQGGRLSVQAADSAASIERMPLSTS